MGLEHGERVRQPLVIGHGRATVVFSWHRDRWGHEVLLGDARWGSVEAVAPAGDPCWPESPALVEVSRLDVAGRPAILGLGLAGRSHFSLSVTPHPGLFETFLFEAACRVVEPPGWLGSTYSGPPAAGGVVRMPAGGGPAAGLPGTVRWSYTIGPGGIAAVACEGPADRSHFA